MRLTALKPVPRTYLWQDAAAALRQAMVTGDLKPGDRVSEARIARQLGVSRAPVRDAIQVLVKEGLLAQRNGATEVVGCSDQDLEQLYDARQRIEYWAIELAAGGMTAAAEAELREAVAAMKRAAMSEHVGEFVATDLMFHRALCRATGHRWLTVLWETLGPTLAAAAVLSDLTWGRHAAVADLHEALLERVLRGETEVAQAMLHKQMRGNARDLIRLRRQRQARASAN